MTRTWKDPLVRRVRLGCRIANPSSCSLYVFHWPWSMSLFDPDLLIYVSAWPCSTSLPDPDIRLWLTLVYVSAWPWYKRCIWLTPCLCLCLNMIYIYAWPLSLSLPVLIFILPDPSLCLCLANTPYQWYGELPSELRNMNYYSHSM